MGRTRIKFCGVCRPEDAVAAAAAGADAVGVVLYPGAARYVTIGQARAILAVLPPFVTPVGLFVDQPVAEVLDAVDRLGLRTVQLHGDEPLEQVAELRSVAVIKAVRTSAAQLAAAVRPWRRAGLAGLLLETPGGPGHGGTGLANDWDGLAAARDAGEFDGLPPVIVAGGLTAETVGAVVRRLRPFAVDVSSGIEASRGVKSAEKIAAFVDAVWRADHENSTLP